ncbi:hypothetical protein NC651_025930 [Populus alba x Populus x berolinensis]|nr:hypothetical protein NC651_025930 [Populus alba x Populus x berolinensis]
MDASLYHAASLGFFPLDNVQGRTKRKNILFFLSEGICYGVYFLETEILHPFFFFSLKFLCYVLIMSDQKLVANNVHGTYKGTSTAGCSPGIIEGSVSALISKKKKKRNQSVVVVAVNVALQATPCLANLIYSDFSVTLVVIETLRIANIIGGIFRRTMLTQFLKDGRFLHPLVCVHLDHGYFKDARTFNPWRLDSANSGATCPEIEFTPFGRRATAMPQDDELARVGTLCFPSPPSQPFQDGEDKLVFFPTTGGTQKRYPINVLRRDS